MRSWMVGGMFGAALLLVGALELCEESARAAALDIRSQVDPEIARQGGEDFDSAVPISAIPVALTGSTSGHQNDTTEYCGGYMTAGPDVVYVFTAEQDMALTVDSCNSSYQSIVWVFDAWENQLACGMWTSDPEDCGGYATGRIDGVEVEQGATYYVVIGGLSSSDHGDYIVTVEEYQPCDLECSGYPEGEPAGQGPYDDHYNGGCSSNPHVFQALQGDENGELTFCGRSGWHLNSEGVGVRDSDWFTAIVGASGVLEWTVQAEVFSYAFHLSIPDCDDVSVLDRLDLLACAVEVMEIEAPPGTEVALWVGPYEMYPSDDLIGAEYDYVFTLRGLATSVAVERNTWSAVKRLFGGRSE